MCIEGNFTNRPGLPPTTALNLPKSTENAATEKVSSLMQQVIDQKQQYVTKARTERLNLNEFVLVGGDLFSMGYLAFQGAQIVKTSLAANAAIGIATSVCGVAAGVINIGVAFCCLREAIQASKNGDTKLALRLSIDFVCLFCIGIIMSLASLAARVSQLGAINTFFAANPWLLPVIFFAISIPIMLEIATRIKNIWTNTNLASQLKTEDVNTIITGKDLKNPYHLAPILQMAATENQNDQAIKTILSQKMEQFQADMGVEAAIETFKLMKNILKKEDPQEQMNIVKKKISEWNKAQYVRMFQQILYTAAFAVSIASLSPKINTPILNGTQTFAMSGANAVPLYMDTFWPFKRNTPIVVPIVE
jgi:hypothetical protein